MNKSKILIKYKCNIDLLNKSVLYGSLARNQKYQSLAYWKGIEFLLLNTPDSAYIYGASSLPQKVKSYIANSTVLRQNTVNFGWLAGQTVDIASLIQIYVDTIPFGSGLTAAECILGGGCYLGTVSDINKEASFTNILYDSINLFSSNKINYNTKFEECGIFDSYPACVQFALELARRPEKIQQLHDLQKNFLTKLNSLGQKYFTEDYLGFFAK